jgi:NADH dehydrogenase
LEADRVANRGAPGSSRVVAASQQRILVTGAAGVLGLRLCSRLLASGARVRGLVLPNDPQRARLQQLGAEPWEGDLCAPASLQGICAGIDTVYHLAAIIISHDRSAFQRINRDGTAHMVAAAAAAGVRHFIYVSSASVTYPRRTAYAQSKLEAERLVASEGGFEHTIVRPTLVYDRHGGQELLMFLDYLRKFPVVPFIGQGMALKRPVWAEDIVDGLVRLAGNRVAFGKTYNFSGGEAIAMLDFARLLLRHHATNRPFVHVPVVICRAAARLLDMLMDDPPLTSSAIAGVTNDADLDPAEAMRDLGYRPIGVHAGFERCFPTAARIPEATRQPWMDPK